MSTARRGEYEDRFPRLRDVVVECGPGRARQSMKDECDINNIVARYARTGMVSHMARGAPVYVDVSELGDYREVVDRIARAERVFAALPAKVRAAFDNSAPAFMDACLDPSQADRLVELGVFAPERAADSGGAPSGEGESPKPS